MPPESVNEIVDTYWHSLWFVSAVHVIVRSVEVAISITYSELVYDAAVGKFHVGRQGSITLRFTVVVLNTFEFVLSAIVYFTM